LKGEKGGRPVERDGKTERSICRAVFAKRLEPNSIGGTKSLEDAISEAAGERSTSEGAIRGVIERCAAEGLTFDWWVKSGQPPF
jgi:hypothetical protein